MPQKKKDKFSSLASELRDYDTEKAYQEKLLTQALQLSEGKRDDEFDFKFAEGSYGLFKQQSYKSESSIESELLGKNLKMAFYDIEKQKSQSKVKEILESSQSTLGEQPIDEAYF